jgi:hypothetical protein
LYPIVRYRLKAELIERTGLQAAEFSAELGANGVGVAAADELRSGRQRRRPRPGPTRVTPARWKTSSRSGATGAGSLSALRSRRPRPRCACSAHTAFPRSLRRVKYQGRRTGRIWLQRWHPRHRASTDDSRRGQGRRRPHVRHPSIWRGLRRPQRARPTSRPAAGPSRHLARYLAWGRALTALRGQDAQNTYLDAEQRGAWPRHIKPEVSLLRKVHDDRSQRQHRRREDLRCP